MRQRLHNRRKSLTSNLQWKSVKLVVTYGFDDNEEIREIFINAAKTGEDIEVMMNDAATAFSIALQSGRTPAELYKSMRRDKRSRPASILGFVLRDMAKQAGQLESEDAEAA
jgi:hypothetical protein